MNRADWQAVADERLLAAKALLDAQLWSSAYYLAGYAVECGLKSCILVRLAASPGLIFEKEHKDFQKNCWAHKLEALLTLAGLKEAMEDPTVDPLLRANWATVKEWNEQSRYEKWGHFQSEGLYSAITDAHHGVMQWIRVRW